MFTGNHRSFRLTPESCLDSMQVKPRLWWVHLAIWILRLTFILGGIALFWAIVMHVPTLWPASRPFGLIGAVGHLLIAFLMNNVGFLLGRALALRYGWLSASEASHYHRRMYRWPDCWLEIRPGHDQPHPLDPLEKEQAPATEHSAYQILKSRVSTRTQ